MLFNYNNIIKNIKKGKLFIKKASRSAKAKSSGAKSARTAIQS